MSFIHSNIPLKKEILNVSKYIQCVSIQCIECVRSIKINTFATRAIFQSFSPQITSYNLLCSRNCAKQESNGRGGYFFAGDHCIAHVTLVSDPAERFDSQVTSRDFAFSEGNNEREVRRYIFAKIKGKKGEGEINASHRGDERPRGVEKPNLSSSVGNDEGGTRRASRPQLKKTTLLIKGVAHEGADGRTDTSARNCAVLERAMLFRVFLALTAFPRLAAAFTLVKPRLCCARRKEERRSDTRA